jgi:hypothetical protein
MKWQVKGEKRGLAVGLTAPTSPVRGLFRPVRELVRARPWTHGLRNSASTDI